MSIDSKRAEFGMQRAFFMARFAPSASPLGLAGPEGGLSSLWLGHMPFSIDIDRCSLSIIKLNSAGSRVNVDGAWRPAVACDGFL
jgi:hypothetical protein